VVNNALIGMALGILLGALLQAMLILPQAECAARQGFVWVARHRACVPENALWEAR